MQLVSLSNRCAINPRFIKSVQVKYLSEGSLRQAVVVTLADGEELWSEFSYADTVARVNAALGGNDEPGKPD